MSKWSTTVHPILLPLLVGVAIVSFGPTQAPASPFVTPSTSPHPPPSPFGHQQPQHQPEPLPIPIRRQTLPPPPLHLQELTHTRPTTTSPFLPQPPLLPNRSSSLGPPTHHPSSGLMSPTTMTAHSPLAGPVGANATKTSSTVAQQRMQPPGQLPLQGVQGWHSLHSRQSSPQTSPHPHLVQGRRDQRPHLATSPASGLRSPHPLAVHQVSPLALPDQVVAAQGYFNFPSPAPEDHQDRHLGARVGTPQHLPPRPDYLGMAEIVMGMHTGVRTGEVATDQEQPLEWAGTQTWTDMETRRFPSTHQSVEEPSLNNPGMDPAMAMDQHQALQVAATQENEVSPRSNPTNAQREKQSDQERVESTMAANQDRSREDFRSWNSANQNMKKQEGQFPPQAFYSLASEEATVAREVNQHNQRVAQADQARPAGQASLSGELRGSLSPTGMNQNAGVGMTRKTSEGAATYTAELVRQQQEQLRRVQESMAQQGQVGSVFFSVFFSLLIVSVVTQEHCLTFDTLTGLSSSNSRSSFAHSPSPAPSGSSGGAHASSPTPSSTPSSPYNTQFAYSPPVSNPKGSTRGGYEYGSRSGTVGGNAGYNRTVSFGRTSSTHGTSYTFSSASAHAPRSPTSATSDGASFVLSGGGPATAQTFSPRSPISPFYEHADSRNDGVASPASSVSSVRTRAVGSTRRRDASHSPAATVAAAAAVYR
ncbi:hypothetical protein K435DRAFT_322807 [Dendrothele bispora CBS 962.96]|uniref:Uncharacterized protein n=1 Tax=Dendrothele bispora (strain CBS 962.96) TaxID=1314807 RepID=A0A4S8MJC4_DENBC|nr:hypothetical protein K435DRAFT_322807 [Dendrothele bispora CBS 962.96]